MPGSHRSAIHRGSKSGSFCESALPRSSASDRKFNPYLPSLRPSGVHIVSVHTPGLAKFPQKSFIPLGSEPTPISKTRQWITRAGQLQNWRARVAYTFAGPSRARRRLSPAGTCPNRAGTGLSPLGKGGKLPNKWGRCSPRSFELFPRLACPLALGFLVRASLRLQRPLKRA
jgi:hypothetical protein